MILLLLYQVFNQTTIFLWEKEVQAAKCYVFVMRLIRVDLAKQIALKHRHEVHVQEGVEHHWINLEQFWSNQEHVWCDESKWVFITPTKCFEQLVDKVWFVQQFYPVLALRKFYNEIHDRHLSQYVLGQTSEKVFKNYMDNRSGNLLS